MKFQSVFKRVGYMTMAVVLWSCGGDSGLSVEEQFAIDDEKIEAYIATNNLQDVQTTTSGLRYIITREGTGNFPEVEELVVVHYKGSLLNGNTFDSSYDRGAPFTYTFGVGQVISGFDLGVQQISEEAKGTIIIPSYLAYGRSGSGSIGANEVLVFEIEVLSDAQILEMDLEKIDEYIDTKSLTDVVETSSGLNYIITEQGTGDNAKDGDAISLKYKGYLLDGTVFDETTSGTFDYTIGEISLIDGWEEAVSLLNEGAKGTFMLPSGIGYGKVGYQDIDSNIVLIFDIELVSIN
ncbi:FKBP-type peptidyl-prolyl cis-trans isomerase [Reichenbachiella sp. MALMAid0571]|uniref:FKBP-type peptidyl-prolyl cis-trans isomerase n=1 Tax=Reichenbachiella sp. MALMAid0571 TaxID=3143939 RepID=UPI0032DEA1A2